MLVTLICYAIQIILAVTVFKRKDLDLVGKIWSERPELPATPLFYIPEENKTLAQMNFEEKSKYSARKRAILKMIKFLKEVLSTSVYILVLDYQMSNLKQ